MTSPPHATRHPGSRTPDLTIDRREFVQDALRGGLVLLVTATGCQRVGDAVARLHRGASADRSTTDDGPLLAAVYIHIERDGNVTIMAHRSEMGQGTRTSLAMLIADELEADWARVHIHQAPGDEKTYGSQNTDGSSSIRGFYLKMREAGATGRALLEGAAAKKWGVPVEQVRADHHRVVHVATGRSLDYGALVAIARTVPAPSPDRIRLKDPSAFRYIGKEIPMLDLFDITVGRAKYGIDQTMPDALIAVVARPAQYGATLATVDARAAERVPGVVRVIPIDHTPPPSGMAPLGGVAVVATTTWAAIQGRNALQVAWTDGPNAAYHSSEYQQTQQAAAHRPGKAVRVQGDGAQALSRAARRITADYYVPHLSHAPMEPPVALASVRDGRCEIWAPTQDPQGARNAVAKALGMPIEMVRVNVTLLGGAFGRKCFHDFILEAAILSRAMARPVKVQWTREDDVQHDFYHPPAAEHLEAGLDSRGRVVAWLH